MVGLLNIGPAVRGRTREDTARLPAVDDEVRSAVPLEATFPCVACGADNLVNREICATCGVDLDTGLRLPHQFAEPDDAVLTTHGPLAPAWHLPVLVAIGAAIVIVVGLALAGIGPFASPTTVPEASLDADSYPDARVTLELSDIATMTTAPPDDGRSFAAGNMVDDDPSTAWRSNAMAVNGADRETVELFLAKPAWVEMILIRNGDHASSATYEEAARVHRALIDFDGGLQYVVNLLDQGRAAQVVELPAPALTTSMRIEVLDVFAGADRTDIAISDLELLGRLAQPDDAQLARERAETSRAAIPDQFLNLHRRIAE